MTKLEKIKEFIAKIGLLPLAKLLLTKPLFFYNSYIFKKSSARALRLINESLIESKVTAWIEFGTFLGATRTGKIISHDLDIDLAVPATEDFSKLEAALIRNGFKLKREISLLSSNTLVEKTFGLDGANVDFFFVFNDDNSHFSTYDFASSPGMTWGETISKRGGLIAYKNTFKKFSLSSISLHGIEFKCPDGSMAKTHLTELYGPDYNIPNSKWHLSQRTVRKDANDIGKISFFN